MVSSTHSPRSATIVIAILAALAVTQFARTGVAVGAIAFPPAQILDDTSYRSNPEVIVDGRDEATIAWRRWSDQESQVKVAHLNRSTLESTVTLDQGDITSAPQMVVDEQNRVTVFWAVDEGGEAEIRFARISASGEVGAVRTIPTQLSVYDLRAAIDHQGLSTLAWTTPSFGFIPFRYRIQSVQVHADGAAGAIQTLPFGGRDSQPQVAVDPAGTATVVWKRPGRRDSSYPRIQAARFGADGSIGPVTDLSGPTDDAADPRLAIDDEGHATVVWEFRDETNRDAIQAVRIGAGGHPGEAETLSRPGTVNSSPAVDIDSHGRSLVVWTGYDGPGTRIESTLLSPDGHAGPVGRLSTSDSYAYSPEVAFDSRDRAMVVWRRYQSPKHSVQALRLRPEAHRRNVVKVAGGGGSSRDGELRIAFDTRDRPRIVWPGPYPSTTRGILTRRP